MHTLTCEQLIESVVVSIHIFYVIINTQKKKAQTIQYKKMYFTIFILKKIFTNPVSKSSHVQTQFVIFHTWYNVHFIKKM